MSEKEKKIVFILMKYKRWWDYNHIKIICMEWEHLGIESNCARWNSMITRGFFVLVSCSNSLPFIHMPLEPLAYDNNNNRTTNNEIWISLVHRLIVKKEVECTKIKRWHDQNQFTHALLLSWIEHLNWEYALESSCESNRENMEEKAAISSFCVSFFFFLPF